MCESTDPKEFQEKINNMDEQNQNMLSEFKDMMT